MLNNITGNKRPSSFNSPEPKRQAISLSLTDEKMRQLYQQAVLDCVTSLQNAQQTYNQTLSLLGFPPEKPLQPVIEGMLEDIPNRSLEMKINNALGFFLKTIDELNAYPNGIFKPVDIASYTIARIEVLKLEDEIKKSESPSLLKFVFGCIKYPHLHLHEHEHQPPAIINPSLNDLCQFKPIIYAYHISSVSEKKYSNFNILATLRLSQSFIGQNQRERLFTALKKDFLNAKKFNIVLFNPNNRNEKIIIQNITYRQFLLFCFPEKITVQDLLNFDNYIGCKLVKNQKRIWFIPFIHFFEHIKTNWMITSEEKQELTKFTEMIYLIIVDSNLFGGTTSRSRLSIIYDLVKTLDLYENSPVIFKHKEQLLKEYATKLDLNDSGFIEKITNLKKEEVIINLESLALYQEFHMKNNQPFECKGGIFLDL